MQKPKLPCQISQKRNTWLLTLTLTPDSRQDTLEKKANMKKPKLLRQVKQKRNTRNATPETQFLTLILTPNFYLCHYAPLKIQCQVNVGNCFLTLTLIKTTCTTMKIPLPIYLKVNLHSRDRTCTRTNSSMWIYCRYCLLNLTVNTLLLMSNMLMRPMYAFLISSMLVLYNENWIMRILCWAFLMGVSSYHLQ